MRRRSPVIQHYHCAALSFVAGRICEAPTPPSSLSRWKTSSSLLQRWLSSLRTHHYRRAIDSKLVLLWFTSSCHRYAPIQPAPDFCASVWRSLPARTRARERQLFSSVNTPRKKGAANVAPCFAMFAMRDKDARVRCW